MSLRDVLADEVQRWLNREKALGRLTPQEVALIERLISDLR